MVCWTCRYGMALAVQFSMIISVMECSTWNKAKCFACNVRCTPRTTRNIPRLSRNPSQIGSINIHFFLIPCGFQKIFAEIVCVLRVGARPSLEITNV